MSSAAAQPAPTAAGCLLIQVAAKESLDTARLADRAGSGLVFTGVGAVEAVHAARRQGYSQPLLTDRRRYAGAARARGTASFAPSWLAGQRAAGVTQVLTDSGYVGEGDGESLRGILGQAAAAGPDVTAVLPLHAHWLRQDRSRLITEIGEHGVPVAIVLEHRGDALAASAAAAGLIEVLRQVPSVAMLATGTGALAALAYGARWAAVGVRSSLRHLHPVGTDEEVVAGRTRWRPAAPEIVATPVLSFAPLADVVRAAAAAPDGSAWACLCSSCRGRTPQWLASASAFDADAHSFDVLLGHAGRLRGRAAGPARELTWRQTCGAALDRYHELGLAGLGFPAPRFLAAWAGADARAAAVPPRPGDAVTGTARPALRTAG